MQLGVVVVVVVVVVRNTQQDRDLTARGGAGALRQKGRCLLIPHSPREVTQAGRLWAIDHPERGLMMITANSQANPTENLPEAQAWAEELLSSITFVDIG